VSLFSREGQPELVIRPHAPMRRMILTVTLVVVMLAGLYAAFEFGRYYAGYSVIAVMRERARLNSSITQLQASNQSLQARIIELETSNAGHAREDQVVARTIGDLQAQVARQTEELAFYRAVVAEGAPAIGVRVGTVRLAATKPPGHFLVNVSLVRAGKTDGMATGTVSLTIDGQDAGGKAATLDSKALAAGDDADVTYDFRYFQDLEQTVTLPPGFRPEHLTVEVNSSRKDVAPLTQTLPWSAVAVP
jgi:cell division protein FtsB